ncbi:hypothetical protein SeMB42_g04272 [Synchytrium endobioticum]|uniref:Uncharacterized protein n=1 Tax=Synchytrium endobioticum TaxID=286115 RepID=A0A507CZK2_9FUNG|nr:hypothetical protein SeMB42_g04274 [Synchytrium endobioticum]TPX44609.1 hypothetical protein SeMB42_g04272 [Synchytrium endobioticum]
MADDKDKKAYWGLAHFLRSDKSSCGDLLISFWMRIDIEVVTRMAKFITISLLAYAAAFLFFTPDRAVGITDDEKCVRDVIFAVTHPITGTEPLSYIRGRIKYFVSSVSKRSRCRCSMDEVRKGPTEVDPQRYTTLRNFHDRVFAKLKGLFECLTKAINENNNDNVLQTLRMAQALVWPDMINHLHLEGSFRSSRGSGPSAQNELELPAYDWEAFKRYVDANAFLESLRSLFVSETAGALPAPSSSAHALPGYSGTRHDGPDSGYGATAAETYVSDTQGALPDPSLLDSWRDHDPQDLPYDTEFALPAHEQVGPSSSGTLNNPYDYGLDEPNLGYVSSHQAPPSPELTDIYKDPAFIQYEIELGRRAHEQAGPSGGNASILLKFIK